MGRPIHLLTVWGIRLPSGLVTYLAVYRLGQRNLAKSRLNLAGSCGILGAMGKKELAEILKKHREWLRTGEGSPANLGGVDLGGVDLGGVDLGGANLSGANLSGANLSGANLSGANLSGANLSWANLGGVDLGGVDLGGVDLGGANLGGANLGGANLSGVDLGGANLGGANLGGANLRWADLRWANLGGANLGGVDLSGANLSGANLSGANLSGAYLRDACLPSPTMVLLASWGTVSDDLCSDLMNYDAACHSDHSAFYLWVATGKCPYADVKFNRAAQFYEVRRLWNPSRPLCRPWDLMVRVIREKCTDSDFHDTHISESNDQ